MEYRQMALEILCTAHPKEKWKPKSKFDEMEHVQAGTMRYLLEHGNIATPAQLTEFFGFSQARLTKVLNELEKKGMVMRDSDPTDRRRIIVRLTDQGYAHAVAKWDEMLDHMANILQVLGPEDAAQFCRIVKKLADAEALPAPPLPNL